MAKKIKILENTIIETKIKRMALEIWERHSNENEIIIVGIKSGGYTLAKYIQEYLEANADLDTKLISIELNKKDYSTAPILSSNESMKDKCVILIDDVANSGKTLAYALLPIMSHFPKKVTIAVLIERMHKSFPIKAEIVGHEISTTIQDNIIVEFGKNNKISVTLE